MLILGAFSFDTETKQGAIAGNADLGVLNNVWQSILVSARVEAELKGMARQQARPEADDKGKEPEVDRP